MHRERKPMNRQWCPLTLQSKVLYRCSRNSRNKATFLICTGKSSSMPNQVVKRLGSPDRQLTRSLACDLSSQWWKFPGQVSMFSWSPHVFMFACRGKEFSLLGGYILIDENPSSFDGGLLDFLGSLKQFYHSLEVTRWNQSMPFKDRFNSLFYWQFS